jgi:hypothetical protein
MYSFGSNESQYTYKTLIDERNEFVSLSSKVTTTLTSGTPVISYKYKTLVN